MFDDDLSICIRYSWKEISDGGVSLLVDFFLIFGYGFRNVKESRLMGILQLAQRCARLFNYLLPDMVANTVQGDPEILNFLKVIASFISIGECLENTRVNNGHTRNQTSRAGKHNKPKR